MSLFEAIKNWEQERATTIDIAIVRSAISIERVIKKRSKEDNNFLESNIEKCNFVPVSKKDSSFNFAIANVVALNLLS